MAKIHGAVVINEGRCKGCDLCVAACPVGVLVLGKEVNAKGYNYAQVANPNDCIGCAHCGYVCPDACITVYKTRL